MLACIPGQSKFRKGMDLYFERHDGCAVACDDFVNAMEDTLSNGFKFVAGVGIANQGRL